MPNCFRLTKKGETAASPLNQIDDEMCAHFGVVPDVKMYYHGWYDFIGFLIAVGKPLGSAELRKSCEDLSPEMVAILDYLEANYTSDAWAEIGRR